MAWNFKFLFCTFLRAFLSLFKAFYSKELSHFIKSLNLNMSDTKNNDLDLKIRSNNGEIEAVDTFIENLEENLKKITNVDANKIITDARIKNNKKGSFRNEYDRQVQEIGSWIDDKFLKELLQENFEEEIKIVDHAIEAAVNAGDNYMGTLYRTNVEYMVKGSDEVLVLKLMIKGAPSVEAIMDMIIELGVFDKEIFVYNDCLPKMRGIFDKYLPKTVPFMAPFSYKCMRSYTIVMEDLREKNYVMVNRKDQLDFVHTVEVLKAIARFQALSLKVIEDNPEFVGPLSRDTFLDNKVMDDLIEGGTPAFFGVMKTWDECTKYVPLMNDLCEALNKKLMVKLLEPGKFNVLNHGDIWVNNVLFKYNEDGSLSHCVLVDYQIVRYNSPVLDVLYFLFASVQSEILVSKMNVLLRTYYNTFMETLKATRFQLDYTYSEFRQDFEDRLAFGFFAMIVMKPIMLAETKVDFGGEEEQDEDEHIMTKNFRNPKFKKSTIAVLHYSESIGFLNILRIYLKEFLKSKNQAGEKNEDTSEIPEDTKTSSSFLGRIMSSFSKMIDEPICS